MLIINNQEDMDDLDINSIQNVDEINFSSIFSIPENKFHGLKKLKKITIANTKIIETGAFMNCENLQNINFIKLPKYIGDYAFYNTKVSFIPELYPNVKFGFYNNLGKNITLQNTSWFDLDKLSKMNTCQNYFKVGDEKTIEIKEYSYYDNYIETIITYPKTTYTVQIYGFNHDDLADGSGKAGVTFGFKEILIATHDMNPAITNHTYGHNIGGWKASEMRTFLNNEEDNNSIYNLLPVDLQTKIKEVNKISDVGNKNTTNKVTTIDKLFLLSLEEVGLSDIYNVTGQGIKYDIFSNNISRIKYDLNNSPSNWWLRSTGIYNSNVFKNITSSGTSINNTAGSSRGVAPAFCI